MFVWIVHNTLLAALLAAGVLLLCRLRRCSPALLHALWLLVLLRLVAPPGLVNWPWQVPTGWFERSFAATEVTVEATAAPEVREEFFLAEVQAAGAGPTPAVSETPAATAVPTNDTAITTWLVRGGCALWAFGAVVLALRFVQLHFRFRRLVHAGVAAHPRLCRFVAELAEKMQIPAPEVRLISGLASPLVGGLWRPVLLWPEALDCRLTEAGCRAVLVHELAHLRRRDHWIRLFELVAECMWWWNPVFRVVRARIRQYAEQACDAWVLAVMPHARRAYADALVEVCSRVSHVQPLLALGIEGDGNRDFQRRLTMIMRERVACKLPRRALLALAVAALIAVPSLTLAQRQPPPTTGAAEALNGFDSDHTVELLVLDGLLRIDGPVDERDKKLAELEAKIQAILKDIHTLKRKESQKSTGSADTLQLYRSLADRERAAADDARRHAELQLRLAKDEADKARAHAEERLNDLNQFKLKGQLTQPEKARPYQGTETVVLSRTAYTLTSAKAEALAKFLKENVKSNHLTSVIDGGKLTVTTTPEIQKVVGALVDLMQGQAPRVEVKSKAAVSDKK